MTPTITLSSDGDTHYLSDTLRLTLPVEELLTGSQGERHWCHVADASVGAVASDDAYPEWLADLLSELPIPDNADA